MHARLGMLQRLYQMQAALQRLDTDIDKLAACASRMATGICAGAESGLAHTARALALLDTRAAAVKLVVKTRCSRLCKALDDNAASFDAYNDVLCAYARMRVPPPPFDFEALECGAAARGVLIGGTVVLAEPWMHVKRPAQSVQVQCMQPWKDSFYREVRTRAIELKCTVLDGEGLPAAWLSARNVQCVLESGPFFLDVAQSAVIACSDTVPGEMEITIHTLHWQVFTVFYVCIRIDDETVRRIHVR